MSNPCELEHICGNCLLFHPETSIASLEATQSAVIATREETSLIPEIKYGKMGCFDDAYGTMSSFECTVPTQFEPRDVINSIPQT